MMEKESDLLDLCPPLKDLDYKKQILDEICLEGLDGITLQALWLRLKIRPGFSLGVEGRSREFIWEVVRNLEDVQFFKLKLPRNNLVVHDRYKYMDGDLGIVVEPDFLPEDIYPFQLVEDNCGVQGSCQSFTSRTKVGGAGLSLAAAEAFGGRLVMVGSQAARTKAILGEQADPLQAQGITAMQWALLERIGRSRFQGEVTQGNLSLQFTHENPKTLFYHRKALLSGGLLTKQVHHQKTTKQLKNQKTRSQNSQGTLFHLPRFFVERQPKTLVLVGRVVEFLRSRHGGRASYDDLRNELQMGSAFKKLFKTQEFQRFVRGDVKVPFRTMYPSAEEGEWRRKSMGEERQLRVVELINHDTKPDDVFKEKENQKAELEVAGQKKKTFGVLDQSGWVLDRSMMSQAYRCVESAGPEGISQQDLGRKLGHGKLEARTICRNLIRRGLVMTILNDQGRQRVTNFVVKKFQHLSPSSNQFLIEKAKNDELTGGLVAKEEPNRAEDGEGEGVEGLKAEEEVPKRKRSEEPEEDNIRKKLKTESLMEMSESNSCDSSIFMSISSDFQLDDRLKSPVKRREKKTESKVTFRQLRRENTIIEAVRRYKVVDDPTKLFKMIQENESKEGYQAKMDKKSLLRILTRLGVKGQIKNITVKLELEDKTKNLHFVCAPEIDESNSVIQSAIEQARMKFNSFRISPEPDQRELDQSGFEDDQTRDLDLSRGIPRDQREDTPMSRDQREDTPMSRGTTPEPGTPRTKAKSNRRYGLQPKFVRMRELHILLFYLSRDYGGQLEDTDLALQELVDRGQVDQEDKKELKHAKFFSTHVNWKMFIPPLPSHSGWEAGWCLMSDILLRLPLSVFVKLVHITMDVPGLQEYLAHPVKQHLLIRHLPSGIRTKLLHLRKYIFTIHEVATRLAYIGVLQFGPQTLKEKDQVNIYINKQASLLDTTASAAGYHQVEPGKDYPMRSYALVNLMDVDRFWYDMWEICINTPLGESSSLTGQEITLEVMDRKPEMIAALAPREPQEAVTRDQGHIPGDSLGAAGLDSSIFAHLKRNWSWNTSSGFKKGDKLTKPPFCIKLLADERDEDETEGGTGDQFQLSKENLRVTTEVNKAKENRKRKKSVDPNSQPKKVLIKEKTGRPIKFVRVVGKRKTNVERKPYYDEKDKAALRLMRKLRVDWSPREDSFLLLCKAVGSYLCTNSRTQMVQYTSVRDLLHNYFPESCNKTSRACQRRLNYMMKNGTTADNVALFLADIQQDEDLMEKFPRSQGSSESRVESEARLEREFAEMVDILINKHRESPGEKPQLDLPDSMEEILQKYTLMHPSDSGLKAGFQEPTDIADIHSAVVYTLVTSSLCTASDKRSWTFQLFKIYQQYPDDLLRKVMATLRENKMVSLKKQYNKLKVKQGNYLPLSSSPYQLSVTFSHTFLNRYQYDIYSQSWGMMKMLLGAADKFTDIVIGQEGGYAAAVVTLLANENLVFRTEVPEQLVVLDPGLSAVDENYVRILQRYKELLRNAGGLDATDVDAVRSPTKLTSTTLFRRKESDRSRSNSDDSPEFDRGVSAERTGAEEEADRPREKRVTGVNNQIVWQEGSDSRSNTTLAKSASRIALYMMREELRESPLESGDPVQHSHDFFVISSCTIQGRLADQGTVVNQDRLEDRGTTAAAADQGTVVNQDRLEDRATTAADQETTAEQPADREVTYSGGELTVSAAQLPAKTDRVEAILLRYGLALSGMTCSSVASKERITYCPLTLDSGLVHQQLRVQGVSESVLETVRLVCQLIDDSKELGLSKTGLRDASATMRRGEVVEALELALQHHLVLQVGIVEARFVGHKYSRDWLIHSYKLNRVRDVDKMQKMKYAGKLYQGHGPHQEEGGGTSQSRRSKRSLRGSLDEAVGREDIKVDHRLKNPQTAARLTREVSEAADKINWDDMEEVLVHIRPWVRVDGSLNRRVIDRLLGAVLGAVMQHPGSILATLTARFSPALQPTHAKELILLLAEIEAVQINRMTKPNPPGLWSKPEPVSLEPPDILDYDDELVVEPCVEAVLRLGQFIGDKLYNQDFVCHCPCHPERRM